MCQANFLPLVCAIAFLASTFIQDRRIAAQENSTDPLRDPKNGLTVNKPSAFVGYTLIAPMNSKSTYLIDMEGQIINEWVSDYTPALSAYLLEDGALLRPGAERGFAVGGPGAGGRIQKFTWEGELVWDYSFGDSPFRPHHDICPLPNGNVLVIATDAIMAKEAIAAGRLPTTVKSQLLPECILEIKPTGKTTGEIVWKWRSWDHIIQDVDRSKPKYGEIAEYPERIDLNFSTNMFDRMMNDPQQLAKLRSLGYVGGGTAPEKPKSADKPKGDSEKEAPKPPQGKPEDKSPPPDNAGPPRPADGDWMHVNSVAYNPKLDQIVISVHEFSEIWIIDHSTTTAEAASHHGGRVGRGGDLLYRWGNPRVYRSGTNVDQRMFGQHCAHWVADDLPGAGNLLVFNNGLGRTEGEHSSIDEIVPPLNPKGYYDKEEFLAFGPDQPVWSYTASDKTSFYSMLISGAQRLPNANTLICSGGQGLIFEVTPDKEIVWMYKHPDSGFGGPPGMKPGSLVPGFVPMMLRMTEDQKKAVAKLQTIVDEKRAKLLTDEQRKKLANGAGFPFGPPGAGGPPPGFRPPRVGEVMPSFIVELVELTPEQTTSLAQIQKYVDEELAKIWNEQQKKRLEAMEQRAIADGIGAPPGFGPPGFGPPGFGPPGFGPPGAGPPGPPGGGPPGAPGGIFRSYRYGPDYPGLAGRSLKPGKKLEDVAKPAAP